MRINKCNDFIAVAEQDSNSVTIYFAKVDDLDKTKELYLSIGYKLLQDDSLNKVIAKCATVKKGIFDDEYTIYTDIVILTLK